jgi:hypothetical protein
VGFFIAQALISTEVANIAINAALFLVITYPSYGVCSSFLNKFYALCCFHATQSPIPISLLLFLDALLQPAILKKAKQANAVEAIAESDSTKIGIIIGSIFFYT